MGNEREVRRTAEHAVVRQPCRERCRPPGCSSNGLDFASITNTTWKGFITLNPINDRGDVDTKAVVQVGIKATSGAATATSNAIFGVQGTWSDDGDGVVNSADTFACMGIATSMLYVK